jgi:hypothetical protein
MSDNNNVLIIGAAVLGYLYLKRKGMLTTVPRTGAVPSMPGSAGTGLQQIATGAVSGFIKQIMSGAGNNTSQTTFPASGYATPYDNPKPYGDVINETPPPNWWDSGLGGSMDEYSGAAFA